MTMSLCNFDQTKTLVMDISLCKSDQTETQSRVSPYVTLIRLRLSYVYLLM